MTQTCEHAILVDRLNGTLLGTALGDALGLPAEGMRAKAIRRRFGQMNRFRLLGRTGFVSDDTEQAALVAQSLARHLDQPEACVLAFRRALLGWFCRLPWGIGLATLRSCLRIALRLEPSGVMSAGNGAAMRAAIIGVCFHDRPTDRRLFTQALAQVTHRDPRAVEGALYVAELAALSSSAPPDVSAQTLVNTARTVITNSELDAALTQAIELAARGASVEEAAITCGTSGYVVCTLAFATFCFLRFPNDPMQALSEALGAGGDTDSIGAILGAWLGARHGEKSLPAALINKIHDGPFGPTHLRALASCLANRLAGRDEPAPRFSIAAALTRNLALYPVILVHGFRRLVPF